jgi:hypothetical protein
MRLFCVGYLSATEIVLLEKLGINEVFMLARDTNLLLLIR